LSVDDKNNVTPNAGVKNNTQIGVYIRYVLYWYGLQSFKMLRIMG